MRSYKGVRPVHAAAALGAVAVLAAGCFQMKLMIDSERVEQEITKMLAKNGFTATVTCPKDPAIEEGAVFTCDATGSDGTTAVIRVLQKDNKGTVSFELEGALVDTREIGESVKTEVGDAAIIECPRRWVVLKAAGETTSCTVRLGDERGNLEIELDDAKTRAMRWKITPAG
jgi:hypothetical protein